MLLWIDPQAFVREINKRFWLRVAAVLLLAAAILIPAWVLSRRVECRWIEEVSAPPSP